MKVAVGEKVAGKFQYNRFAALMNNPEYFNKAYASTQNADGMMNMMQETYAQGIEGRLNTVRAAGEQVLSTLFNQDAIEPVLEDVTELLEGLNDIIDAAGGLNPVLTALGAVMLKTFSSQISSNVVSIADSLKTSISATSNVKNMGETLRQLGIVGAGLDSETYNEAAAGVPAMRSASSETKQQ